MSLCRIFAVSDGYFARLIWGGAALHHSSTEQSPCLKLVNRSNLVLTSYVCGYRTLQTWSKWPLNTNLLGSKCQDTYWSIPKALDQAITFSYFLTSDNIASSQSNIFSYMIFHFRNLWYRLSFTVQSILGPSIYGIYIGCTTDCVWLVDGWMNCGLCITTSSLSEFESCDGLEFSYNSFVLVTGADSLLL